MKKVSIVLAKDEQVEVEQIIEFINNIFNTNRNKIIENVNKYFPKMKHGGIIQPNTIENNHRLLKFVIEQSFSKLMPQIDKFIEEWKEDAKPATFKITENNDNTIVANNRRIDVVYDKNNKKITIEIPKAGYYKSTDKKRGLDKAWEKITETFNAETNINDIEKIFKDFNLVK